MTDNLTPTGETIAYLDMATVALHRAKRTETPKVLLRESTVGDRLSRYHHAEQLIADLIGEAARMLAADADRAADAADAADAVDDIVAVLEWAARQPGSNVGIAGQDVAVAMPVAVIDAAGRALANRR